jgi:hypothetical protein
MLYTCYTHCVSSIRTPDPAAATDKPAGVAHGNATTLDRCYQFCCSSAASYKCFAAAAARGGGGCGQHARSASTSVPVPPSRAVLQPRSTSPAAGLARVAAGAAAAQPALYGSLCYCRFVHACCFCMQPDGFLCIHAAYARLGRRLKSSTAQWTQSAVSATSKCGKGPNTQAAQ